jgi:hypothetical protein
MVEAGHHVNSLFARSELFPFLGGTRSKLREIRLRGGICEQSTTHAESTHNDRPNRLERAG